MDWSWGERIVIRVNADNKKMYQQLSSGVGRNRISSTYSRKYFTAP